MRVVGVVLAALVAGGPAHAETATQKVLERFQFFGTWALDCERPAAADNPVRSAPKPSGKTVMFTESLGGEANVYVIKRAKPAADDTISVRIELNGEIRQDLTIKREGDRLRTMTNRDIATKDVVVREGIVLSTGEPTPWLKYCRDAEKS